MNSSINSNFDDLVVLNDSSDNHENIFSIFRDFQNSGSRPGTTFSGDRLISFISLETGDDEKSIQLANRMLELNLFSEISKNRISFIQSERTDEFRPSEYYRYEPRIF